MKSKIIRFLLLLAILINLINCAKRGSPTGGEKDVDPPVVISSSPESNTLNFDKDEIRITFDEYIKLENIQKQLIVSPPLKNLPEIFPMGTPSKYLELKLNDTLLDNTTYVFNFGQSIVDNNEGNPYPFLKYVFSTGDYIDSLTLDGIVHDAIQKKADEYISVMLYKVDTAFTDSIIYKNPPMYMTNTLDSSTTFQITNIKEGKYMLVAIKDVANNYLFNQKTDKIAFLNDFIEIPTDSVFNLTLFKEIANFRASIPSLAAKNRIIFGYEGDPSDMNIELLSDAPEDFKYTIIKDRETDTLHYWFTPFEADSLLFKVETEKTLDTFNVRIKELYNDSLLIEQDREKTFGIGSEFRINSKTPLVSFNKDSVSVIDKDSISVEFTSKLDTLLNQAILKWETEPNQQYKIALHAHTFKDFYGNVNDSIINYSANTKSLADLGSIRVKLNNAGDSPIIVQLTDEKGKVFYEIFSDTPEPYYEFKDINPSTYLLRIIFDTNGNKKWDTGNYLQKIQPERISYYPSPIELKPNWELEEEFTLK